jgi:acyl carrier protein
MSEEMRRVVFEILGQIAPEADLASLDEAVPLQDQLDMDSMDLLNFVVGLSERTGIEVPERDYPRMASLAGCVEYLDARAKAA